MRHSPSHNKGMTPSDDAPALPDNQITIDAQTGQARSAMRRCWLLTGAMIAATGIGLASCVPANPVPAPPPAPAPAPASTPTSPPVVQAPTDWLGEPLAQGDWTYVSSAAATHTLFGPTPAQTLFTVACEPGNRQVKLWRPAAASGATTMTITTTEAVKTVSAAPASGQVVATLAPHDPILDAMIFTRGRFAVQVPGTETLYLPSWPEIARVVEDCR
ncbi:hypothetical protein [Croceicoccus bisphenolivorans]|uniref:hypothetical protein n=1 Tax=Croceicoccus bisphenolivorans TaxID=1783232 RepID=UPI000A5DDE96|nr:hypothetical protein [Croceicoccus bisphenolivorans]